MIANEQMEFGISTKPTLSHPRRTQRRIPGARWWFEQMHRAVDQAPDLSTERLRQIKQADFAFPGGRN